jgi:putative transcriptional regulator
MSGAQADGAIEHHPSEATLVDHAARALWPAAGLVVEAHLAHCPDCRGKIGLIEEVGGLLVDGLPPTPLSPDALERMMVRLDEATGPAALGSSRAAQEPSPVELPAALQGLLHAARPRWVAPGVRHALLLREVSPGGTLRLLRVSPGTALPRHDHRGLELTLVLEGAFADEAGRYGPGDLAEVEEGATHQPVALGPLDCVCLLATQGRLRFHGPMARLFGILARV